MAGSWIARARGRQTTFLLAAALLLPSLAMAAEAPLRVGRSPAYLFVYVPIDVGIAKDIFSRHGVTVESVSFGGAAKMDLAMTADSIDVGLGSPMEFAAIAKGLPAKGIGTVAGPMVEFGVLVPYDSPAKSFAELEGKAFGIATQGSITQWAVFELGRTQGWDLATMKIVAIGGDPGAAAAALKTHQVDATIHNVMQGVAMERAHTARVLGTVGDYARHFIAHTMMASLGAIRDRPQDLKRFLAGYYESVAYMREHKAEAVAVARTVTGLNEEDESKEYDLLMPGLSRDGRFDKEAIPRIGRSFVELKLLEQEPDMAKLYTEAFLP